MSKTNRKGRSSHDGRYLRLTHFLMGTPAWRTMNAYGRAAYIEIAALYDGSNNGYLAMGERRLADNMGVTPKTVAKALKELQGRGFIEIAERSGFSRKDRRATEFRLTDLPCDRSNQSASKAYQRWRPEAEPANDVASIRVLADARRAA